MNPSYLLAALGSGLFGAADFAGGIAARRAPAPLVTAISGFGALAVLFLGMPFTHGAPTQSDLLWGLAAGACSAAGATLIYKALALGPMSLASPVLCLIGLCIPVVVGVFLGERPSGLAWTGVGLAVVAIPLLSLTGEGPGSYSRAHIRRTLLVSIAAGLVVGWFLVAVARIGGGAGLWPLVIARSTGVVLLFAFIILRRQSIALAPSALPASLGAGALDSSANVAYWFAVQAAPMALVSSLISLAPATTVVLARVTLGERWTMAQGIGLGLALVAGVLISIG
jgi:drug/metabolite transporter (DMT)-like permease